MLTIKIIAGVLALLASIVCLWIIAGAKEEYKTEDNDETNYQLGHFEGHWN